MTGNANSIKKGYSNLTLVTIVTLRYDYSTWMLKAQSKTLY